MKKKWLSMLLSCALLASSVMPSFTAVAADRGGADAAPTAAVEEAAPTAEETAPAAEEVTPAAETAPVAVEAADVPAATASGDKVVTVDGVKYSVDVKRDFEDDSLENTIHWNPNAQNKWLLSPTIANIPDTSTNKAYGQSESSIAGWGGYQFKLDNTTQVSGDGIYFRIYMNKDAAVTTADIDSKNYAVCVANYTATVNWTIDQYDYCIGNLNNYPWKKSISQYMHKSSDSAGDYAAYDVLIPFADLKGIQNTETVPATSINEATFANGVSVGLAMGVAMFGVKPTAFYYDDIGFYTEAPSVHYTNSYYGTTWQNPLASASDAANTQVNGSANYYAMSFQNGTVRYTINTPLSTGYWNTRMYIGVDGQKLNAADQLEFKIKLSNARIKSSEGFTLRVNTAADLSGGLTTVPSTAAYTTSSSNTDLTIKIPISVLKTETPIDLTTGKFLNLNYQQGTEAQAGDYIEISDVKLLGTVEDSGTFPEDTKVVNVTPSVQDNGALDVTVTNNGEHNITWKDAKDVSLQVKEGARVTLTAKPAEGMRTVWTNVPDQGEKVLNDTITFAANDEATPSATFEEIPNEYMVKVLYPTLEDAEGYDKAGQEFKSYTYTEGETPSINLEVPTTADGIPEGYTFDNKWKVDQEGKATLEGDVVTNVTGDVTFTPVFRKTLIVDKTKVTIYAGVSGLDGDYHVTLTADESKDIPDQLGVAPDTKVTLTAPDAPADKKFSHWVKGNNPSEYIMGYETELEVFAKGAEGEVVYYTAVYVDEGTPVEQKATLNVYSQDVNADSVVVVFEWRDAGAVGFNVGDVILTVKGSAGQNRDQELATYKITSSNGYYTLTVTFNSGKVPENFTLDATLTTKGDVTATTKVVINPTAV